MADGSVEIKITGSIDPSVTTSANEAKAAMAGIGDSTAVSAKAMAAALAATGGNIKKITPEMLGLAAATQASAAASTEDAAAKTVDTVATEANTAATINSRAAYESLVLVHEALQGRFTRMAGSSMILTQQLAGQAAISKVVAFATSGLGAAILGTVAAIGAVVTAQFQYEESEKRLEAASIGLAAASGLTADQLEQAARAAADYSGQSTSESTKAAEAFAAAGVKSQASIEQLSASVETYAQLTGQKFADAQKTLAEAMQDPIKGAEELHQQLGILNGDQIEQISKLTALGEKDQAVAILVAALKERIDDANRSGVGFSGTLGTLANGFSNLWGWIGRTSDRLGFFQAVLGGITGVYIPAVSASDKLTGAMTRQVQEQARLNDLSAKGADIYNSTPEAEAIARKTELIGKLNQLHQALDADTKLHGANSDAVKRDKTAIEDYTHASNTYLTAVQKKSQADALDVKIAEARHAHNKQLVADLTEQKTLLQEAGKVESDNDARTLAKGAGDVAGARTGAGPKGAKGPDIVSQWEEQLHNAEIASNDFFSDQTQKELQFWQGKLALTKTGSKDWLDVQSHIYDAAKTLAHQDYDEHLADLNDRLQADRDDYKKFQADWAEKLAFIKSKFGEESTEYRDAHREMEADERDHQNEMDRAAREGEQKALEALKQHLAAMRQVRETDAQTAEALIKDQADSSILGEAAAAARIGQLHHQLSLDEIADAQAAHTAEDIQLQQAVDRAEARYGEDVEHYQKAIKDKETADRQWADQLAQLQAKASQQQIQDILAVEQAYSTYVSGTIGATIQGFDGMISGTQTWRQAVIGVYQSVVSSFESSLAKMATKWVVEHVFMTAAQRAQLTIQNAAQATSEATKTAVTTTGVATRAGVENTGFFAKILGLLGINLGAHTGTEAAKTAATATGAATRAAAEGTAAATSAATQIATNVTTALSHAAVAGAAGTASWAAAPWPIDAGAPAFGAAMYADAASYAALASLDVGTNYMPRDQVVQAHEGERIIPKADNRQLMDMMSMAASGDTDGGGRSDVHLHYSPTIHERERMGLRELLASDSGAMIDFLNRQVRDGKLKLKPA